VNFKTRTALFLLPLAVAYQVFSATPGRYVGEVIAKWLDDGRVMELQKDFGYVDPSGKEWISPKGAKVDGASIPPAAWSLIGGPFEGKYRNASVIHDVACQLKNRPWQVVHRVFYDAMLTSGVNPLIAKTMYAAVLVAGPRWSRQVALRDVPYTQAQGKAFAVASSQGMSGEIANTRIVLGPTVPQSCPDCINARPNLPPQLANVEIIFEPQPSIRLTEQQVLALKMEIKDQDLSVEQIENRYLVDASGG
jgi:hypothetical protein